MAVTQHEIGYDDPGVKRVAKMEGIAFNAQSIAPEGALKTWVNQEGASEVSSRERQHYAGNQPKCKTAGSAEAVMQEAYA
ncbi:hypothetical protein ARSEF4850_002913 [Beauveria asiatica]